jgi:hypothetical protein
MVPAARGRTAGRHTRSLRAKTHDAVLDGEDQRLEAGLDTQFPQQIDHVGVHGLATDMELLGDLFVAEALSEGHQHLALPRREASESQTGTPLLAPALFSEAEQAHQLGRLHYRLPGAEAAHGGDDLR